MNEQVLEDRIRLDPQWLRDFCQRYRVERLSVFGSVLTDRFDRESDVDVLVAFQPGHVPGFLTIGGMMEELTQRFGRQADVRTVDDLGRGIREEVLQQAEPLYVAQ